MICIYFKIIVHQCASICHVLSPVVSVPRHLGVSDEESDAQQELELVQRSSTLTYIASGMGTSNHSDFFFGDGDTDQLVFESEHFPSIQNCQVGRRGIRYSILLHVS